MAERLLAQVDNEDIRLLLAESYLGDGKGYKAYEVLKSCTLAPNRYKFALVCIKLNKLPEAERALLSDPQNTNHGQFVNQNLKEKNVPNGAAGMYLLGYVREMQTKRKDAAKNYYSGLADASKKRRLA